MTGGHRHLRAVAVAAALFALSSTLAPAATVQSGNLRVSVFTQVRPFKLPRVGTVPITVSVAGHLKALRTPVPPQLRRLEVQVNRAALLQARGLPACGVGRIQPASSQRALRACKDSLIGSGQFWANIVLPEQRPYPTRGRILIFHGNHKNRPALLAHIFTENPFASSFVIPFAIDRDRKGRWGTKLTASLPQALGEWGFVDRIKLNLGRKYGYRGKRLSYFNAGCPAAPGAVRASYQLAKASFYFAQAPSIAATVTKACGVR